MLDFDFRHGCFAVNTLREKHIILDAAYATVKELVEGPEEHFRLNLQAVQDKGEIPGDADVVGLTKLLAALDIGILSYGIVSSSRERAERMFKVVERLWG